MTKQEFDQLQFTIQSQTKRRKRANPDSVSVMIDGEKRAALELDQESVRLSVDEGARLVEIKSEDAQGELLLGSLLLDQRELLGAIPSRAYRLELGRRHELLVTLTSILDAEGEIDGADLAVRFRRAQSQWAIADMAGDIAERARAAFRNPVWAFSTVVVVLIVAAIGVMLYRRQARTAEYVAQVQFQSSPLSSSELGQTDSDQRQRSKPERQDRQLPAATMTPQPGVGSGNKSKLSNGTQEETRSLPGQVAAELAAVRRIHVEESAGGTDNALRDAFMTTISASGKLKTTGEVNADAFFVWRVERVNATQQIEALLLSRDGKKLWGSSRSVPANDNGAASAAEMAQELIANIAP